MTALAAIASMFVRATGASRVLEVGTGDAAVALAVAEALPTHGVLMTLERNAVVASAARRRLAAATQAATVSVIIGDAARYLHKLAGPFELVIVNGDPGQYERLHERVIGLLAPAATLVTHKMDEADRYNEVLSTDHRLNTATLRLDRGIAISVRRRNTR